ncbi:hypothetical protein H310_13731 [Aphanomyces invadans]|uniref:Uncharacterized protein n=1 Tax=Aphanomyces invadans TaxID=157072 RepID=A0A024TEE2_9STRA|nr:hypothetical protein H310_13731 [Aphanomyces invadans]ETV91941.1 hypothetical protein H310_13731 [Aphanomyces invadans]|eukprot:XP_008879578.1 hypothetical protein H310_13731 [Aphanomyces invadans]
MRRRFYLWADEDNPPRHVQSKSHITKVMFWVAVAEPRSGWDGKCIVDCEVGEDLWHVGSSYACNCRGKER